MNNLKIAQTVKELREKAIENGFEPAFRSVGRSMWPLMSSGDKLLAKKMEPGEIKFPDIIIWNSKNGKADSLTAHRVIRRIREKGKIFYRTKGDFNAHMDDEPVAYEQVVGTVIRIKKKAYDVDLSSVSGKTLGLLFLAVSCILAAFSWFLRATGIVNTIYSPEIEADRFGFNTVLRSTSSMTAKKWQECVRWGRGVLIKAHAEQCIADVQLEGGYSEEAFSLIREGRIVDSLKAPVKTPAVKLYDYIIFARLIDLYEPGHRTEILASLAQCLKPGGKLLISLENYKIDVVETSRKMVWNVLFARDYIVPGGTTVKKGQNTASRQGLNLGELKNIAAAINMKITDSMISGNMFCAALAK